jgi:hypothetical protein
VTIVSENSTARESFFKLTSEELKQAYRAKDINARRYILWIVKTHGKAGWKWTFTVKDFCSEWEINERTFYRAVSKLKMEGLLHWEIQSRITVWYGTDSHNIAADTDVATTDTDDSPNDSRDKEIPATADVASVPETPISSSDQINSTGQFPKVLEKHEQQLKLYGITRLSYRGDQLIDNPKLKPVIKALSRVSVGAADKAVTAFLNWVRNAKNVDNVYRALELAISRQWQPI